MIEVKIPGREKALRIQTVALDYNGTIAVDGVLLPAAAERIRELSTHVDICVLTADTYGTVMQQCRELGVAVKTFPQEGAAVRKEAIVRKLGSGVCAVGNGFNDIQMFDAAELAVAVLGREGMCAQLLAHADVLVTSPEDALDLLLKANRLRATLRN